MKKTLIKKINHLHSLTFQPRQICKKQNESRNRWLHRCIKKIERNRLSSRQQKQPNVTNRENINSLSPKTTRELEPNSKISIFVVVSKAYFSLVRFLSSQTLISRVIVIGTPRYL